MRPLLCGYYGEHNIGDDLLLQALLHQLPSGCRPLVTARDQEEVRRCFGVETCARRPVGTVLAALGRCDALVLGGGSLLQDSTSFASLLYYAALIAAARLRGLPVLLWAQGLGPLRRRRSRLLVRWLLPMVQGITWRDAASARMAAQWGIRAPVGSDPVWSLPAIASTSDGRGPIVLCWRDSHQLDARRWRQLLEALGLLVARNGVEVIWLPFHRDQDSGLLQRLQAQDLVPADLAAHSRECALASPHDCQTLFGKASLVLAMRLHGLILAALSGPACVALSYDPKVSAAADALGCPVLSLDDLDDGQPAAALADRWSQVLGRGTPPEHLVSLRNATAVHADLLARWLGADAPQLASPKAT
ncbi:MAG: polysaccharide pyruvyl transferase CsaB [Cyanobacteriota bacterium]|nr:polysaccharide pyruvyl transferase CsaB [Cyanobacteriota bacterium]